MKICLRLEPTLFATYNLVEIDPVSGSVAPFMTEPSTEEPATSSKD